MGDVGGRGTASQQEREPAGGLPFPLDLDRVIGSLHSTFNPLHRDFLLDFHVSGARNGYVYLSIALPEGMTRAFTSLLESMAGFFRCIDVKARSAVAIEKAVSMVDHEERQRVRDEYSSKVCDLFDDFLGQGHDVKASVRLTNSALKAQGHPWATHNLVTDALRAAGRFRKPGRAKGVRRP